MPNATTTERHFMNDLMQESTHMTRLAARMAGNRILLTLTAVLAVVVVVLVGPASALAGPLVSVTQQSYPTNLKPGGTGAYVITVENAGDQDTSGQITVTDTLPPGVTAAQAGAYSGDFFYPGYLWSCPNVAGSRVVTCTSVDASLPSIAAHQRPQLPLRIDVQVDPSATGVAANEVAVSGGSSVRDASSVAQTRFSAEAPGFGIAGFSGMSLDRAGERATQAGGHPDVSTTIEFNTVVADNGSVTDSEGVSPQENVKDVNVDLPAGLVANPKVAARCTSVQLMGNGAAGRGYCPAASQVGTVDFNFGYGHGSPTESNASGLYNMVSPRGVPAQLAANFGGVLILINARVRPDGNYALSADVSNVSQSLPLISSRVTLWGVPADPIHDGSRIGSDGNNETVGTAPLPFVSAPTSCSGVPLVTRVSVDSWRNPTDVLRASFDHDLNGDPIITDGCDKLDFTPTVTATPSTKQPDTPAGLDVDIQSPQNLDNPGGLANAQLRDVKVTLPEGMTINPGAADGLQACSDAQLGLGNGEAVGCPDGSKIGTVSATTPLLDETLTGGVYIRSQASDDPQSGDMFRMAIVLENKERGILVKLPGQIRVNADTGRIVTEFDDNPQIPVDHIQLQLKSGPRAPLVNPPTCGSKAIQTNLTSWAGHDLTQSSTFDVACTQGLGGFAPTFTAGTVTPVAGAFSPFALSITKPDGNADLNGLRMELPAGLLARLKGNLNTQVGTVKAYAGPGSNPFMLPGKVFLEGRYGDAPFSLRVVVPAVAGPFDLGTVEVRQKIYVDPIDAHVTVVSDPVPTIVKGVPVRLQKLEVAVDKPDFIINPTSCAAKTISGTLSAVGGQTAAVTNRFQVGDCASLALKPDLALSLSGKGQTTDGKHPAITANLTQKPGQANLKKVKVTLPLSMALDPDNANGLCEFVDGTKVEPTCPKNSIVGTATATTPILDEPLSGPVYFVKNVRKDPKSGRSIRTTPKLVIPLTGQNGVKLTLTGTSDVENDQLVTTFDQIPDAPVSGFKLNIIGGKGGILVVSGADICKSTQIADQQLTGQNNKAANTDVSIQTPSCPLKVLSKKVGKSSVAIKVGGLSAGKVTITGKGIKKTTKTITKSTVATITAKRTKGKPGKVTVSLDPTGPVKAHKTTK
jgi:uncharacterized repeat protein (TIGR01451 family)